MQNTHIASEWIKVSTAAAEIGINPRTLKNMLEDGRLQVRTLRLDRSTRIHREDWETELAKRIRVPVSA